MYQQKIPYNPRECLKCIFYILNTFMFLTAGVEIGAALVLMQQASRFAAVALAPTDIENPVYGLVVTSTRIAGLLCGVGGVFSLINSFTGCCGMLNRKPGWLKTYWIGAGSLILINLFVGGVTAYMLSKVNNELETRLKIGMQRYDGQTTFNTFFFDYNQVMLSCCGINGRNDYQESAWFQQGFAGVPMSCCQLVSEEKKLKFGNPVKTLTTDDLKDPTCPIDPNGKPYTTQPCLERIRAQFKVPLWLGLWCAGFCVIILFCMGCASRRVEVAFNTATT